MAIFLCCGDLILSIPRRPEYLLAVTANIFFGLPRLMWGLVGGLYRSTMADQAHSAVISKHLCVKFFPQNMELRLYGKTDFAAAMMRFSSCVIGTARRKANVKPASCLKFCPSRLFTAEPQKTNKCGQSYKKL